MTQVRTDWSMAELRSVYRQPLLELIHRAATVHRQFHDAREIQVCMLFSLKTGGCPEDCAYCSQSAHYKTGVRPERLLDASRVLAAARQAKANCATRFCMGAAWKEVHSECDFEMVLEIVRGVSDLGLEVCCTLGMLTDDQARRLKQAGLTSYNHNLDTGEDYYPNVVTTRTYQERLETLRRVRSAGISLCCGGILGMGESVEHRLQLLRTLATLDPHPESVPINALVPIRGTPLENRPPVPVWDMVRMIATARIALPRSMVRLAAGRQEMSPEGQALCFLAGANSIFSGEKLLTTANCVRDEDRKLLELLDLRVKKAYDRVSS